MTRDNWAIILWVLVVAAVLAAAVLGVQIGRQGPWQQYAKSLETLLEVRDVQISILQGRIAELEKHGDQEERTEAQ